MLHSQLALLHYLLQLMAPSGSNRLVYFKQCLPEAYVNTHVACGLFASKNTSVERWHPWILPWILQGGHEPFGLTPSPFSLMLCPTSGSDTFLVLITSPSSYSTFSSFASPEICLHLSIFLVVFPSSYSHRIWRQYPIERNM